LHPTFDSFVSFLGGTNSHTETKDTSADAARATAARAARAEVDSLEVFNGRLEKRALESLEVEVGVGNSLGWTGRVLERRLAGLCVVLAKGLDKLLEHAGKTVDAMAQLGG